MKGYPPFKLFFLVLGWILPNMGFSQAVAVENNAPVFVAEQIVVHTDRQLYISGETIWFKAYVFDAQRSEPTDFSRVGYLELIGPEGTTISQVKIALDNGLGTGSIELAPALNSGNYTLRAYTRAMRNSGENTFYQATVLILNPNQPIVRPANDSAATNNAVEVNRPSMEVAPDKYLNIGIQSAQTNYDQRSLVTLEISTLDARMQPVAAQVSLSVALRSPATTSGGGLYKIKESERSVLSPIVPKSIDFSAESQGMLMNGRVINESTNSGEADAEVYLAFPGKTALVYVAQTDEEGHFSFLLPKLFGLRQIVLQVRPKKETNVIRIELEEAFHPVAVTSPKPFVLPPAWQSLANAAMINAQIGQAYQAFELPPVFTVQNQFANIPFYGEPEAHYSLDEYTRFSLTEFFYEVVWQVRVKGKFGEERLKVLNEWENTPEEIPPLLLVDGVPVFDDRTFLKINNKLIASADVVTAPFWLNPGIVDGIIHITSFDGDARCFSLPETALRRAYPTFLPQRQLVTPDYSTQVENRLPDFRNTLYWNPTIQTDAAGKATVSFFTSDAIGEYLIRVEGLAAGGLLGSGQAQIKVTKTSVDE